MASCRLRNATLVIAKLDRLSRDVHFLTGLTKQGVKVRIAEMPEADETWFNMMAVFAQHERKQISSRTKQALAAKAARGEKVGDASRFNDTARRQNAVKARAALSRQATNRATDVMLTITGIQATGVSTLMGIAAELNKSGVTTARGKEWTATQVMRVMQRVDA
jgi:DNA invertase Pin-like site-specific DNA recombinase